MKLEQHFELIPKASSQSTNGLTHIQNYDIGLSRHLVHIARFGGAVSDMGSDTWAVFAAPTHSARQETFEIIPKFPKGMSPNKTLGVLELDFYTEDWYWFFDAREPKAETALTKWLLTMKEVGFQIPINEPWLTWFKEENE